MNANEKSAVTLLDEQRSDIVKIDPRSIVVDEGFNVRTDYGDIESLALSIAINGVKTPLRGYRSKDGGMIHLTDGYRRNRAIQLAIEKGLIDIEANEFRVPIILEKRGYRPEDRIMDMFITQDNKPLAPIEVAEVFYRLHHNFDFKIADIAKRTGKSLTYVNDMLALAAAPVEIRNEVKEGNIKAGAALHIVKESKKKAKKDNSGKPANEVGNAIAVNEVKEAIAEAKANGKTVATKKLIALPKVDSRLSELVELIKGQDGCEMIRDFLNETIEYLGSKKKTSAEMVESLKAIAVVYCPESVEANQ